MGIGERTTLIGPTFFTRVSRNLLMVCLVWSRKTRSHSSRYPGHDSRVRMHWPQYGNCWSHCTGRKPQPLRRFGQRRRRMVGNTYASLDRSTIPAVPRSSRARCFDRQHGYAYIKANGGATRRQNQGLSASAVAATRVVLVRSLAAAVGNAAGSPQATSSAEALVRFDEGLAEPALF